MAVPMRAHHLLCMLSYSGEGYSPAFVHGFNGIVQRLGAGEPMELVTGPDAICAPLCNDACAHCHNASVTQRDFISCASGTISSAAMSILLYSCMELLLAFLTFSRCAEAVRR